MHTPAHATMAHTACVTTIACVNLSHQNFGKWCRYVSNHSSSPSSSSALLLYRSAHWQIVLGQPKSRYRKAEGVNDPVSASRRNCQHTPSFHASCIIYLQVSEIIGCSRLCKLSTVCPIPELIPNTIARHFPYIQYSESFIVQTIN